MHETVKLNCVPPVRLSTIIPKLRVDVCSVLEGARRNPCWQRRSGYGSVCMLHASVYAHMLWYLWACVHGVRACVLYVVSRARASVAHTCACASACAKACLFACVCVFMRARACAADEHARVRACCACSFVLCVTQGACVMCACVRVCLRALRLHEMHVASYHCPTLPVLHVHLRCIRIGVGNNALQ